MRHPRTGGVALMNSHSLESDYVSMSLTWETQVSELAGHWPAVKGFWERWCKEHQSIARTLGARETSAWQQPESDPRWNDFLKLRQRLVSTLGQGLNASEGSPQLRIALKRLLAEHDNGFVNLLQKELERVKEQMTHAFAVKKTVTAYAQTAQYRGE